MLVPSRMSSALEDAIRESAQTLRTLLTLPRPWLQLPVLSQQLSCT